MPTDMTRYPAEWPAIRGRILARAANLCERCGIANGVYRATWDDQDGPGESHYRYAEAIDGAWYGWNEQTACGTWTDVLDPLDRKPARIVLTIAHIHDPDPMNCADDNLQALCQRCHNRLDAPMRARHAAETRRRQALTATGQQELPL